VTVCCAVSVPQAFVTATVYVPLVLTVIDADVALFDQRYDVPPVAVSVTSSPLQNVVGPDALIVAAGSGRTDTTCCAVSLPQTLLTTTEYVPVLFTVIVFAVLLVDQRKLLPPEAVSVTLSPWQNVVGPFVVMAATGSGFTVTDWYAVSLPHEALAITE
jgi:hypothetical protein